MGQLGCRVECISFYQEVDLEAVHLQVLAVGSWFRLELKKTKIYTKINSEKDNIYTLQIIN